MKKSVRILEVLGRVSKSYYNSRFRKSCDLVIKIDLKMEVHFYHWIFQYRKEGHWMVELHTGDPLVRCGG